MCPALDFPGSAPLRCPAPATMLVEPGPIEAVQAGQVVVEVRLVVFAGLEQGLPDAGHPLQPAASGLYVLG